MPLLADRSPRDMRGELDALLAACETKLRAARFADQVDLEDLALAADDLNRAAALAGALNYIREVSPFR